VTPPSTAADPEQSYWELDAELHPQSEELWGLFCYERGALGAEELEDSGPNRRVRHFFRAAPDCEAWRAAFSRAYPALPPPRHLSARRQAVQPWEQAWRAHFTPLRLGRRLLVIPPWAPGLGSAGAPAEDTEDPATVRIVIDPGQGFGTGWHPSTALALEALEAAIEEAVQAGPPPARLLDVGTGSGILAIAGRLLGVPAAVALDRDAVALPEVLRNAALSGVQPAPAVLRGGPQALRGTFPLVIANIVSEVLLAQREALAGLTAPGGCLILSGILQAERDGVCSAYRAAGLHPEREHGREGWVALRLRRG
jgi:ribosomal protein L11 methyltransferase